MLPVRISLVWYKADQASAMAKNFVSLHFLTTLVIILFFIPTFNSQSEELQALLDFKKQLNDPMNNLISWTNLQSTPCQFVGVTCDSDSGQVIGVSITSLSLSGRISPSISALSSLSYLVIANNSLSGALPPELSKCRNLQVLNLTSNCLSGQLPDLSALTNLKVLDLSGNDFSGSFPTWVGNLIGLVKLALAANSFDSGVIPPSIGNLKNLTYLFMASCNLTGQIPAFISEFKSLGTLDFSQNNLSGDFPKWITTLKKLYKIELYHNSFTGVIPPEFGNLTNLQEFDISHNQMTGQLPAEIGNLKNLTVFQVNRNNFWGELPKGLGDLQHLFSFSIYMNNFSGEIPPNLGRFSPLNLVDISENYFSGEFPKYMCQSNKLQFLLALQNNFSGEFPDSYATCKTLQRFRISQNLFNGTIPAALWGLPEAVIIDVSNNGFTGGISSDIGISARLNELYVYNNMFSGEIPVEIGELSQLQKILASNNSFSGQIPSQIGKLSQLTALHLEQNELKGPIPTEIGTCSKLADLDLAQNSLSGAIPATLASLPSLNSLNLSQNVITGEIPDGLQSLKLSSVDFSRNKLSGRIPPQLLVIAGDKAFAGNAGLCVDGINANQKETALAICSLSNEHTKTTVKKFLFWASILSAMALLLAGLLSVSYRSFKDEQTRIKKDEKDLEDSKWKLVSFQRAEFDAEEISNLEEDHLIGSGCTAKVYRLDLDNNRGTFAVKQLRKGKGANVDMAEMEILAKIRHKNILTLYACLTRMDSNFLVLEYMSNGNVHQALRRQIKGGQPELDWYRRHKIAVGAAKGIMYLHHDISPAIIHRDIKSTNILLDEEYEAKIADFGIAKSAEDLDLSHLTTLAGTHGYIAPELGYSLKLTEKSDVYSFGVVLLELITGRGPLEELFGEGKDIVYWVSTHLEGHKVQEVLDPRVSDSAEDMIKVLKVAVLCTNKQPSLRPSMREVVKMLTDADPCNAIKTPKKVAVKTARFL